MSVNVNHVSRVRKDLYNSIGSIHENLIEMNDEELASLREHIEKYDAGDGGTTGLLWDAVLMDIDKRLKDNQLENNH